MKRRKNFLMCIALFIFINLTLLNVYAFEVMKSKEGAELKWDVSSVTYRINLSGGPTGTLSAIQAAMKTWTDVDTSIFTFIYGGTTTSTSCGTDDGVNIVCFGPMGLTGTLAQNSFWYYTSSGQIIDSDIKYNTDYAWATDGSPSAYDVQNVGTHELGHSLSLADLYNAADSEKTMYGYAAAGETKKRTLDQDDMDGISYLYPDDGNHSDLTISSLTVPSTGGAGSAITITDTTKNSGGGSAAASTTGFYLSANSTWDTGDTLLGSRSVPSLAAGASSTANTVVTIPAGTTTGTYYIIAKADSGGVVPETNENNNILAKAIAIGPDLIISALTGPSTTGAGAMITVSVTIKNIGGGLAGMPTISFYLSANSTLDTGDTLLGSLPVPPPPLAAGASFTGNTTVTIPAGTATGPYYIIAKVVSSGETNENNNTKYLAVKVGPDLIISALTVPSTTGAGGAITVSDTTKNNGGGTAGASTTGFYLSANSTWDTTDTLLASRPVPSLAAGASSTANTVVTIPAGTTTGTYYIIAKADSAGVVPETNDTTNNTSAKSILIGADLTVSSFTVPSTAAAGGAITVTDTTKNNGGGTAGVSTTGFYLSANSTWDTTDTLLGSRLVPSLAAGASSTANTVVTIPSGTPAGKYYIIAKADSGAVVAETNENNNTLARAIAIGPDLIISALTVPSTAGAGGTITVSDTTKNNGGGTAGASTTGFYLSANSTWDTTDTLLASRPVPSLAAGASSTANTLVTIPAGTTTGTYYIIAKADSAGVVPETNDTTNNTLAKSIAIGPDLIISALTVPSTAGAGAMITVSDTTKNNGGGTAGVSTTGFYLSANSTWDTTDTLLASRPVPQLTAGASDTAANTLVTIPAGTTTGTYYIIAKADSAGVVPETNDTTNNTSAKSILIGADLTVSSFTVPSTAAAGGAITVTDTTKNNGGGTAGVSTTGFYLSANSTWDTTDTLLASRPVPSLAAGASSTANTVVTIPAGTTTGTYYIIAKADSGGVVFEANENNNTSAKRTLIIHIQEGNWCGKTDQVGDVTFTVANNKVENFKITMYVCSTGCTWVTKTINSMPIKGTIFSDTSFSLDLTGTFTSDTAANGSWIYHDSNFGGYGEGTWSATPCNNL